MSGKILLCLLALSLAAGPARAEEAAVTGTDIAGLARLIHLPAPPQAVRWRVTPLGQPGAIGPTDYSLLALLDYDAAQCASLLRDSPDEAAVPPLLSAAEVADWLPAELRRHLQRESDGSYRVRGTAFAPTLFVRGSFLRGYAVRIEETNILLVALETS